MLVLFCSDGYFHLNIHMPLYLDLFLLLSRLFYSYVLVLAPVKQTRNICVTYETKHRVWRVE